MAFKTGDDVSWIRGLSGKCARGVLGEPTGELSTRSRLHENPIEPCMYWEAVDVTGDHWLVPEADLRPAPAGFTGWLELKALETTKWHRVLAVCGRIAVTTGPGQIGDSILAQCAKWREWGWIIVDCTDGDGDVEQLKKALTQ